MPLGCALACVESGVRLGFEVSSGVLLNSDETDGVLQIDRGTERAANRTAAAPLATVPREGGGFQSSGEDRRGSRTAWLTSVGVGDDEEGAGLRGSAAGSSLTDDEGDEENPKLTSVPGSGDL